MHSPKMSLWLAVLVNVNIVTGGAFFLSSASVAQRIGVWAPLAWIVFGLCIMPLVLSLAELAQRYPYAGGLYVYAQKALGRFAGFVAGWGYFMGTAAGNAVMLHAFVTRSGLVQLLGSSTSQASTLWIVDTAILLIFGLINWYNVEALRVLQLILTAVKIVPVVLVCVALPYAGKISNIVAGSGGDLPGLWGTVPLILFSYVGIEACCAISHSIENGTQNAGRALRISFGIIIALYAVIQAALIAIHGTHAHPDMPFDAIVPLLFNNPFFKSIGAHLINGALLASFLGGFYSMFYANNWNLVAMGHERALPGSSWLTRVNAHGAPWVAMGIQALCIAGLLYSTGDLTHLITMSDFGAVIAYFLSVCAFIAVSRNNMRAIMIYGIPALVSASGFAWFCLRGLISEGAAHILPFFGIIVLGVVAYLIYGRSAE